MSDAAHVGSFEHAVFKSPLKVSPKIVQWDRPDNYLRYEGGADLPEKMDVWLVQDTGERTMSVVSRSSGFENNPNAEIIAAGYNSGKHYGAVAIGRDGNFLQWGFHAGPDSMTEAGKNLFINCLNYMGKMNK